MTRPVVAVVSTRQDQRATRATVRAAMRALPDARIHVLDVDGGYPPVGGESLHSPASCGVPTAELARAADKLNRDALATYLQPALVRAVQAADPEETATILVLAAGVLLLRPPVELLATAEEHGVCLIARSPDALPDDGLWPGPDEAVRAGSVTTRLVALRGPQPGLLEPLEGGHPGSPDNTALWRNEVAADVSGHVLSDAAVLLSPWSLRREHRIEDGDCLRLDGRPVTALDLSNLDPDRPWLLDAAAPREPRARLSDHPALARAVQRVVTEMNHDSGRAERPVALDAVATSLGIPVDGLLHELYRQFVAESDARAAQPPEPTTADALRAWITGSRPTRYLLALRRTRPDLRRAFPDVPGRDTRRLLRWARLHGRQEGHPAELLGLPDLPGPRPRRAPLTPGREGVTVVGYLRGELGIGESARLMVTALEAAGVRTATLPVDQGVGGRHSPLGAPWSRAPRPRLGTSLICVNADLTPAVAARTRAALAGSYRIGMWYWEVEDFPRAQHAGFAHVNEVWVATDFVRRAVEPHAPVPVRTITPPLPQRGPDPGITRAALGLPDRPVFLFSFDYLSTAERKNPWGLIDAFRRAFATDEGPVLVIKSINAHERPADAERLRLAAAGGPDVLLLEDYLEPTRRDALVALCDVYVSLHRSEGLGLTMAEAMAWGKPVIATGYSGNLQFMNERNSFLVPWSPVTIPPGAAPYPAGGTWADPDLDAAARAMRTVLEQPDVASARGAQAARDIRSLHSPAAAGARIADRLAELHGRPRRRGPTDCL